MDIKRKAAVTALAIALAAPAEGLRNWAYRDPVGIPTICFGYTRGVQMGDYKTTTECKSLLTDEMMSAISTVEACTFGQLPVEVLAAFGDAAYNLGPSVACDLKNSAAARYLRAGKYSEACSELPRWNKARIAGVLVPLPGLTNRRAKERELCLSFT